jgi:hypothetical protein
MTTEAAAFHDLIRHWINAWPFILAIMVIAAWPAKKRTSHARSQPH